MKRILMLALLATACTDPDGARRALENAGYTEIQTGGFSLFGCGKNDDYVTKFRARGVTGKQVDGVVCSGLLKGSTIRTW